MTHSQPAISPRKVTRWTYCMVWSKRFVGIELVPMAQAIHCFPPASGNLGTRKLPSLVRSFQQAAANRLQPSWPLLDSTNARSYSSRWILTNHSLLWKRRCLTPKQAVNAVNFDARSERMRWPCDYPHHCAQWGHKIDILLQEALRKSNYYSS